MKIKHLFLSLLAVATVAATGCKKDESDSKPSLKLDPSELEFEAAAGTKTVKVEANQAWEIDGIDEDAAEWLALSQESGDGAAEIEITVKENSGVKRSAAITFRCSIVKKALTITQVGNGGSIEDGDGTAEKPYSASQALEAAKKLGSGETTATEVYVKGIVSEITEISTQYGNATFAISDDGTTTNQFSIFRCYSYNGDKFTEDDAFKKGDVLVVCGKLINYKGNTPQMNQGGKLISINGGDAPEVETVSVEGVVVAASGISFIVKDAEGVLHLVYGKDSAAKVKVGDTVALDGDKDEHNGTEQIKNPTVEVKSSGAEVTHPEATAVNKDNIASYTTALGYVEVSGTLSISKGSSYDNYNIVIEGTEIQGTIASPVDDISGFDNLPVTVSGYYLYPSQSGTTTYFNILSTKVEAASSYFIVTPTSIDVAAAATSATINVKSSVAWTAVSDNEAFTIDKTSGEGDATITVSFAANTDTENGKTATVKITTADTNIAEENREVTVTINQAKYVDAGSLTVDVLTAALFTATSTTYADFSKVTAPASTAVYAGNSAVNKDGAIQLRSTNSNSGIVSTTSGGKIRKVVVTWDKTTSAGRTLDIYGSNSAYTSAADLYKDSTKGTKLGSIVYGESTELEISGDYEYVGLRSNYGAMYLSEIELSYE